MTEKELEQDFQLFIMELSKKYNKTEDEILKALVGVVKEVV